MSTCVSELQLERITQRYGGELPPYLDVLGPDCILIRAAQYEGAAAQSIEIRPRDVAQYYRPENPLGCTGTSGCRQRAGFANDWRTVDAMALEALAVFAILNRPALEQEAAAYGMRLKRT